MISAYSGESFSARASRGACFAIGAALAAIEQRAGAQHQVVSLEAVGRLGEHALLLDAGELDRQRADEVLHDPVLDLEDLGAVAVVSF
jgi:hypothetical protein